MAAVDRSKRTPGALCAGLLALAGLALGCGGDASGLVLIADAQFDPATAADASQPLNEAQNGVAQTFTVLNDGRLEEFWVVITQGASADTGTIRITVRPLDAMGRPNASAATSIITPIDVDTSTLPLATSQTYSEYDIGDEPGRNVLIGQEYAIVIEFLSRATSTDTLPIARVWGQMGDGYVDGAGSTSPGGTTWTNNTEDYFFRTFVLR